jgi:hypothetical protein
MIEREAGRVAPLAGDRPADPAAPDPAGQQPELRGTDKEVNR